MLIFKEKKPIVDVTFLKTLQDPETAILKTSIVDILCKDELGNQYIVEMQVAKERGFEKRAQYYAAKAYVSQSHKGGLYSDLKEVIFLAIADFVMFADKEAFKSDHMILDTQSKTNDLKDFSFTFLELPKFNKTIDELSSIVDKWAYFFKYADETSPSQTAKIIGTDAIIERVYNELERFAWSEEELRTYDQAEKYEWAHHNIMAQRFDDGLAEGDARTQRKIALRLIKQNMDPASIAAITGLNTDDIRKL